MCIYKIQTKFVMFLVEIMDIFPYEDKDFINYFLNTIELSKRCYLSLETTSINMYKYIQIKYIACCNCIPQSKSNDKV